LVLISAPERFKVDFAKSPIVTAVLLGMLSVAPHLVLPNALSPSFAAVLLGMIAGVYFGFAVAHGSFVDQLLELGIACMFGVTALLGLVITPWLLPTAYLGHSLWDLAHHNRARLRLVAIPQWYVPWCATIDALIAIGLVTVWSFRGVL